jgi:hypothetical protein
MYPPCFTCIPMSWIMRNVEEYMLRIKCDTTVSWSISSPEFRICSATTWRCSTVQDKSLTFLPCGLPPRIQTASGMESLQRTRIDMCLRSSDFWGVTSCAQLKVNRRFGRTCLYPQCRRMSQVSNQRDAGSTQNDVFLLHAHWLSSNNTLLYPYEILGCSYST